MFTALSGIDQVARHDGDAASVVVLQRLTDHLRFLAATNGGEVVDAIGSEFSSCSNAQTQRCSAHVSCRRTFISAQNSVTRAFRSA